MNKPAYSDLSTLEINKIFVYEFWYDYVNPKSGEKVKLCYMHTESFIASNDELERPVPRRENKVIGLMKNELSGKIMTEFAALRPNSYSYLTDDNDENKKQKWHKKVSHTTKKKKEKMKVLTFLEASQLENKINKLEKNKDDVDSLRENYKDFIKNNKLILKSQ